MCSHVQSLADAVPSQGQGLKLIRKLWASDSPVSLLLAEPVLELAMPVLAASVPTDTVASVDVPADTVASDDVPAE